MNRPLRATENDNTGNFAVISGNARHSRKKWLLGSTALAGSLAVLCASHAYALPVAGVIAAGSATIASTTNALTINQSSQNTAINWQSFGIGKSEAVKFVQPNSNSVALNRVLGSDASNIEGNLSANGKVFLVNPNGILFGPGAQVNVGGLVASTLAITDANFMAGQYKFSGAGGGTVLNRGSINAANGGYVALLGANVGNQGVITARLGAVALAAGNAVTLDVAGDGLLNVTVNEGVVNALAQNGGMIRADGGQVMMTAQAAGNLLKTAVNNTGVIEAQTIDNRAGTIKLLGDMQSGSVAVSGTLDASAPNGGNGGFIETSAAQVKVADGTIITTQSAQGQTGTWLIDPKDFTVAAAGGDITGTALGTELTTTSVVINSSGGAAGTNGDVIVSDAVTKPASTAATLTLNAVRDVQLNAAITLTTGSLVLTAGRDVNETAAITTTTGSITATAVRNVSVSGALTTTTGDVSENAGNVATVTAHIAVTTGNLVLRGDNNGAGPNGTASVAFGVGGNVAITNTAGAGKTATIYYVPSAYTAPTDFSTDFVLVNTALNPFMWVFAQGNNKVYDGTTTATLSLEANPPVTLIPGTANFNTKDVGIAKPITYSGYTLSNTSTFALYYPAGGTPGSGTTTGNITPAPLTVTANNATKVYGQTPTLAATAFTDTGLVHSETIGSVAEASPGIVATAGVAGSPYTITPSGATGGTFLPADYTITYVNGGLTVTPAPLTVTANNAAKIYGQTSPLSPTAFTDAGLLNGETIGSVSEASPGAAATAPVAGSPYAITPSGATGGSFTPANYTIAYVNGALTVAPAPLTVTANNATKPYGQTFTPAPTAFTDTGLVNGDTIGSVTETSPGTVATASVAGSPYAITPSAATGGSFVPTNYTIAYANGALSVTPIPLTVTANSGTKPYGQTYTLAPTAFTDAGLVNGDTVGSVTETSPGTVATASVAGSPYAITPSGAAGGSFTPTNYVIAYVNGALTVTPIPLTVTANSGTKPYGQTYTLAPTAFTDTGLVNGDTVGTVTETSPGTVATASVAGSPYAITPSGATGGSFTPTNYVIAYVNGALTVTPIPLTVTANSGTKPYGQTYTLAPTAFTDTGLVNGDTVGSVTETSPGTVATAPVAGSPYVITPSGATGGSFTSTNYVIGYVNGALTVTPIPLTVTADSTTTPYGQGSTSPTAFTDTGLANSDTIGSVTETSAGTVATATGPYTVTPSAATGGTFTPSNYTIGYVNGVLTVLPIVITPPIVTPPVATPPVVTPPDVTTPIATLPTPTSPTPTSPGTIASGGSTDTTSPGTESGETLSSLALPAAVTGGPSGLALAVIGGGVRMPAIQLAQAPTPVQPAPVIAEQPEVPLVVAQQPEVPVVIAPRVVLPPVIQQLPVVPARPRKQDRH